MSVTGNPPYSWADGTNVAGTLLKSQHLCEAMQALTNRANNAGVAISDWSAYDYDGSVLSGLGQSPTDSALTSSFAARHVNHISDLRDTLELVCTTYIRTGLTAYTISTLLQDAIGRSTYNRTLSELSDLSYFDGEDVEELLKAIDLLTTIKTKVMVYIDSQLVSTGYLSNITKMILGYPSSRVSIKGSNSGEGGAATFTSIVSSSGVTSPPLVYHTSGTGTSVLVVPPANFRSDYYKLDYAFTLPLTVSVEMTTDKRWSSGECVLHIGASKYVDVQVEFWDIDYSPNANYVVEIAGYSTATGILVPKLVTTRTISVVLASVI